jgi:SAM-dependent methyltransferase
MSRRVRVPNDPLWRVTPPSSTLLKFAHEFAVLKSSPVLDAGCGFGRNALALSLRGLDVVCADGDLARLSTLTSLAGPFFSTHKLPEQDVGRLLPVCVNLDGSAWPFRKSTFSAIVCVHFHHLDLLDAFRFSLIRGGLLYIETFGGQGQNYLDLPRKGELRDSLGKNYELRFYTEKAVGPPSSSAASVKLLARKL